MSWARRQRPHPVLSAAPPNSESLGVSRPHFLPLFPHCRMRTYTLVSQSTQLRALGFFLGQGLILG